MPGPERSVLTSGERAKREDEHASQRAKRAANEASSKRSELKTQLAFFHRISGLPKSTGSRQGPRKAPGETNKPSNTAESRAQRKGAGVGVHNQSNSTPQKPQWTRMAMWTRTRMRTRTRMWMRLWRSPY